MFLFCQGPHAGTHPAQAHGVFTNQLEPGDAHRQNAVSTIPSLSCNFFISLSPFPEVAQLLHLMAFGLPHKQAGSPGVLPRCGPLFFVGGGSVQDLFLCAT